VGDSIFKPIARRFGAILTASLILIYTLTGFNAFRTIASAFGSPPENWSPEAAKRVYALQHHPLWAFESELVLAIHLLPMGEPLQAKRELLERQVAYRPYAPALLKVAVLRHLQGDTDKAKEAIDMLAAGFPGLVKPFIDYLSILPSSDILPVTQWLMEAQVKLDTQAKAARPPASPVQTP
jgi:hypothetical protein